MYCVEINEVNMMSHSSSSQCVTLTSATAGSSVTGSSYDRQLTAACYPAADGSGNCIPHTLTSGGTESSLPTKGKKLTEMYSRTAATDHFCDIAFLMIISAKSW